jgi:hypothetical protein
VRCRALLVMNREGAVASYPEQIQNLLRRRPGMTVKELTDAIFGPDNRFDQRVDHQVFMMMAQGALRREGAGGMLDPYRYYLAAALQGR